MKTLNYPKVGSLPSRVLARLLRTERVKHTDFQKVSRSYRLAEYIRQLREKGWLIISETRRDKTKDPTGRYVTYCIYYLSLEAIQQAGAEGRDYALKVFEWEQQRIEEEGGASSPIDNTTDSESLNDVTSNPSTKEEEEDSND